MKLNATVLRSKWRQSSQHQPWPGGHSSTTGTVMDAPGRQAELLKHVTLTTGCRAGRGHAITGSESLRR